MSGVNIGTKTTRTNMRDACVYGGFQTDDKLYFRDTGIYIQSDADGYLNLVADTGIKLNTVALTATATELNVLDGIGTCVGYTIGAETTAHVRTIACQIKMPDDATAVAHASVVTQYLSSDTGAQALSGAPDGGIAAGTDGTILIEHTADVLWTAVTEADGDLDIAITETGDTNFYLNTITPDGRIHTSAIITFT